MRFLDYLSDETGATPADFTLIIAVLGAGILGSALILSEGIRAKVFSPEPPAQVEQPAQPAPAQAGAKAVGQK